MKMQTERELNHSQDSLDKSTSGVTLYSERHTRKTSVWQDHHCGPRELTFGLMNIKDNELCVLDFKQCQMNWNELKHSIISDHFSISRSQLLRL